MIYLNKIIVNIIVVFQRGNCSFVRKTSWSDTFYSINITLLNTNSFKYQWMSYFILKAYHLLV